MRGFLAIVTAAASCMLLVRLVEGQEDAVTYKYAAGRELAFIKIKKNWADAQASCIARRSEFVKVDQDSINTLINDNIFQLIERKFRAPLIAFWIGANDRPTEGIWVWADGTQIDKTWWYGDEPNDGGPELNVHEDCAAVGAWGVKKWLDNPCKLEYYYICQKVCTHNLQISQQEINVDGTGNAEVTCTAQGVPVPTVGFQNPSSKWTPTSQTSSVYQTYTGGRSTIFLENANISDSGKYSCSAFGNFEESGWDHCRGERRYLQVKVHGRPTITKIDPESCSSTLRVFWKPSQRALGFEHKILATKSDKSIVDGQRVTPTQSGERSDVLQNLDSFTDYIIKILACTNSTCSEADHLKTEQKASTRGIPKKVKSPEVKQDVDNGDCVVSWQTPSGASDDLIENYVVFLNTSLVQTRSGDHLVSDSSFKVTTKEPTHTIRVQPNRRYSLKVQAETCAGFGKPRQAEGDCETKPAPPEKIPQPSISSDTEETIQTLRFEAMNETNGLISCVFVLAETGAGERKDFATLENLDAANSSTAENDTTLYIAVAVPVTSLNSTGTNEIKLGTGNETACNIFDLGMAGNRKRRAVSTAGGEYAGRNRELQPDTDYSISVVSATPLNDGKVLLQTSPAASFRTAPLPTEQTPPVTNLPTGNGTPWLIPVIVVAGAILVLVIVVLVIVMKKRGTKQHTGRRVPGEEAELDTHEGVVVYENIRGDRQERREEADSGIPISSLEETYNTMRLHQNADFMEQFTKILNVPTASLPSSDFASNPALKKKNRYKNILPYDVSRVPLNGDKGYINACYINGYSRARKFIATQGPLPGTVNDFWLMVLEEKCGVIVMLTKDFEAGKKKCEKYWPDNGETHEYGAVLVTSRDEVNFSSFIKRTMVVKMETQEYQNQLVVTHYQFLKWPDHGAPATTSYLMRMHRAVMESQRKGQFNTPMVIHCSAGAGRTGTFIGFDILVEEYQKTGRVDVYGCVMNMRKQRMEMVQNADQYILLHKLVLESYLFGDTDMGSHDVEERLREMNSRGVHGSTIAKEFANLSKLGPTKDAMSYGQASVNQEMNKDPDVIPYDYNRVKLVMGAGENESPYINASYVESYDDSGTMIAAQGPMESTVEYFWRAVLDNEVTTIVMLTQLNSGGKQQCMQYWPQSIQNTAKYGSIDVTQSGASTDGQIIKRTLEIKRSRGPVKTVTHYQYTGWSPNTCPEDGTEVISLINKMQESMRVSAGVVLVHCSDGGGRTGAFCAILNLIERLKLENKVDVFRAVKDLRDGRPGMVQNLDQYVFCHKVVVDYLKSFDLYSNFGA